MICGQNDQAESVGGANGRISARHGYCLRNMRFWKKRDGLGAVGFFRYTGGAIGSKRRDNRRQRQQPVMPGSAIMSETIGQGPGLFFYLRYLRRST